MFLQHVHCLVSNIVGWILVVWRFSAFPPIPMFFFSFHWAIWSECDGCTRRNWRGDSWLGCRLGRPLRCSSALGMWLRLQPLGFLSTFSPLATWAFMLVWQLALSYLLVFVEAWWPLPLLDQVVWVKPHGNIVLCSLEGLNGVNHQLSNSQNINRQPSKTEHFYRQPSNDQAKISRQISFSIFSTFF